MPEYGIEQILLEIQSQCSEWYPGRGEPRAVRLVGRTPRNTHYIYDVVVEFAHSFERLAVKMHRGGKNGAVEVSRVAVAEYRHLNVVWELAKSCELTGIPRPLGDFSARGAVATEKLMGVPLQSMIMKAALLPGYAGMGMLQTAAAAAGTWLRALQDATAMPATPLDREHLQAELEVLCVSCRGEGLDDASIGKILTGAQVMLEQADDPAMNTAVLNEFTPLNVVVLDCGVGFSDYASMTENGSIYVDPATFLAAVEVLEKYPFCDHAITTEIQERFLDAYGASEADRAVLGVFKMKVLLARFAAGRTVKESPARKKVMWANVMKKFIQMAASRDMPHAA